MKTNTFFLIMFMSAAIFGQSILIDETTFGVKGGIVTGGTLWVEDFSDDIGTSYALNGFVDYRLAEKLIGGISLDIIGISSFEESEQLISFNMNLKAQIYMKENNLLIRPGLSFGYGKLSAPRGSDDSSQLVMGAGVEFSFPSKTARNYLFDIGIIGSPVGGNDDYDITFEPIIFLRGGMLF